MFSDLTPISTGWHQLSAPSKTITNHHRWNRSATDLTQIRKDFFYRHIDFFPSIHSLVWVKRNTFYCAINHHNTWTPFYSEIWIQTSLKVKELTLCALEWTVWVVELVVRNMYQDVSHIPEICLCGWQTEIMWHIKSQMSLCPWAKRGISIETPFFGVLLLLFHLKKKSMFSMRHNIWRQNIWKKEKTFYQPSFVIWNVFLPSRRYL